MVGEMDEGVFVDNPCIHKEGDEYVVYVKRFFGLKRVPVSLGPRSANATVIQGDLKPSAQVVLSRKQG